MSIKPVACADNGVLNWYADSKTTEQIDLYVIPDTHRVVPVENLRTLLGVAYIMRQHLRKDSDAIKQMDELQAIADEKD